MAKSSGNAGSLFFGMTLDTKDFKKRLNSAKKALKSAGEDMRKALAGVAAAGSALGAGLVAVNAGLSVMTRNTAEAINAQTILAQSLGVTTQELAGLDMATKAWGVETQMVIDKMRELGGLDEFKRLADEVKNAGNETQQLNKSIELFGNEGSKMLAVLQLGADGLNDFTKAAMKTGMALPAGEVASLTLLWEEYESLIFSLSGKQNRLAANL